MNRSIPIYAGILFTVIISALGLVFLPDQQLREFDPVEPEDGVVYPQPPAGFAAAGRQVYISMGCVYCHTQQVRPQGFGADIERGWGERRTVSRDYIYDQPHLLGTMRTGPDLANIGVRLPTETWHYQHLYDPQITSPGSIMPPFKFLFEVRREGDGSPVPFDAVQVPDDYDGLDPDEYIVPTTRAKQLVAYLLSLDRSYPVPEASQ